jgi:hypothetical protein
LEQEELVIQAAEIMLEMEHRVVQVLSQPLLLHLVGDSAAPDGSITLELGSETLVVQEVAVVEPAPLDNKVREEMPLPPLRVLQVVLALETQAEMDPEVAVEERDKRDKTVAQTVEAQAEATVFLQTLTEFPPLGLAAEAADPATPQVLEDSAAVEMVALVTHQQGVSQIPVLVAAPVAVVGEEVLMVAPES